MSLTDLKTWTVWTVLAFGEFVPAKKQRSRACIQRLLLSFIGALAVSIGHADDKLAPSQALKTTMNRVERSYNTPASFKKEIGPAAHGETSQEVIEFLKQKGQVTCRAQVEIHGHLAFLEINFLGTNLFSRDKVLGTTCTYQLRYATDGKRWAFVRELPSGLFNKLQNAAVDALREVLNQKNPTVLAQHFGLIPEGENRLAVARKRLLEGGQAKLLEAFDKGYRMQFQPVGGASPMCIEIFIEDSSKSNFPVLHTSYVYLFAEENADGKLVLAARAMLPKEQPYLVMPNYMDALLVMDDAVLVQKADTPKNIRFVLNPKNKVSPDLKNQLAELPAPSRGNQWRLIPLARRSDGTWARIHSKHGPQRVDVMEDKMPVTRKLLRTWGKGGAKDRQRRVLYACLRSPRVQPFQLAAVFWLWDRGSEFSLPEQENVDRWHNLLKNPHTTPAAKAAIRERAEDALRHSLKPELQKLATDFAGEAKPKTTQADMERELLTQPINVKAVSNYLQQNEATEAFAQKLGTLVQPKNLSGKGTEGYIIFQEILPILLEEPDGKKRLRAFVVDSPDLTLATLLVLTERKDPDTADLMHAALEAYADKPHDFMVKQLVLPVLCSWGDRQALQLLGPFTERMQKLQAKNTNMGSMVRKFIQDLNKLNNTQHQSLEDCRAWAKRKLAGQ